MSSTDASGLVFGSTSTSSAKSSAAWGTAGIAENHLAGTFTDSSSSGTVATAVANSFAVPTFAASSATTFTNAANLYIAGDVAAGTNVTLTDSYGLWNAGKSRFDDNLRQYMFGTTKTFAFRRAQGSSASPTIITSGNSIGQLSFDGYNGSGYTTTAGILAQSAENWSAGTSYATDIVFNGTNTGATSAAEFFRIKYYGGISIGISTSSLPAWTTNGVVRRDNSGNSNAIFTDTTSSGTVAAQVLNRYSNFQVAASSATTFTDSAVMYIAGDVRASTNVTLTNSYGLWNVGKTRLDKPVVLTPSALTYASPTSVDVTLASVYTVTTVNATGSVTFNATAGGTAGQQMTILITNDATSAKTITFGTNFLSTGTLTASAASRHTSITFCSNGTSWFETGRAVMTN